MAQRFSARQSILAPCVVVSLLLLLEVARADDDCGASGNKDFSVLLQGEPAFTVSAINGSCSCPGGFTGDASRVSNLADQPDFAALLRLVKQLNETVTDLRTQLAQAAPPLGTIRLHAGDVASVPLGWLACDGSLLSTAEFAALFAVVGYKFGGAGVIFALPDLRGRFALGADDATYELGGEGGSDFVVLTSAQMPQHNHQMMATAQTATMPTPIVGAMLGSANDPTTSGEPNIYALDVGTAVPLGGISVSGSNQPFSVMNPHTVVNYVIRAL